MTLTLKGYLRDNPGGAAVSGKTVSLLDLGTNLAPVTTAFTNLSSSSTVTDANGMWTFTMDLCTGPLYVSADIGGGNTRVRKSDELFQYNGEFIGNFTSSLRAFTNGIIKGYGSALSVAAGATRALVISNGYALIKGFLLGWDSGTKSISGVANGVVGTTRYDFLVLRQYYSGTSIGKQDIVIVQGGTSTDPVVTSSEADLTKFIQGTNIWDYPIVRAKLANGSTVYTLDTLADGPTYPYAGVYIEDIPNALTITGATTVTGSLTVTGAANITGTLTTTGDSAIGDNAADTHTIKGWIKSGGASPAASALAAAGVGASASVVGTDTAGRVTLTTGTANALGQVLRMTFTSPKATDNFAVLLYPSDPSAMNAHGIVRASSTNVAYWELTNTGTLLPASIGHIWNYLVVEYEP